MSLTLEQKKEVVSEVSGAIASARAAVLAEYRGLTVAEMTRLRRQARETGVWVRVVKNTLARRVIDGTEYQCLGDHLQGPLVMALSSDPVAVAKVFSQFAKGKDNFRITVGAMDGKLLREPDVQSLAKLPSREELLAMLVGTMQAPIAKFVRTLSEVPARFVRTLAAVRDAREAG